MLEKITRFDLERPQSIVSCYHMNCCLQKYTTHQFPYCIYYLFQDNFKSAKMVKIQQVHQKIHTKQFLLFYLNRIDDLVGKGFEEVVNFVDCGHHGCCCCV